MGEPEKLDSINAAVVQQLIQRAGRGHAKYGTTMDRNDLTNVEWMRHLQEELMDAVVYLEKLIRLADR